MQIPHSPNNVTVSWSELPFLSSSSPGQRDPPLDPVDPVPVSARDSPVFMSANINGLRSKFQLVVATMATYGIPVFALQETKLNSSVTDAELAIPDYTLFHKDRTANGGGVALYVHNSLSPSRLTGHRSLELIAARVYFGRYSMVIVSCYRPPNQLAARSSAFVSDLTDWLANLGSPVQNTIVFGDLNADPAETLGGLLCQSMGGLNLTQVVTDPTHSGKLLDLCFIGSGCPVSSWGLAPTFERQLDGHAAIFLALEKIRAAKHVAHEFTSYRFCDADWNRAAFELLFNADGTPRDLVGEIASQESAENAAAHFSSVLLKTMRDCVPHKTLRVKRFVPWMTRSLIANIRQKSAAFQRFKSAPSPSTRARYLALHKKVRAGVKKAKRDYVLHAFEPVSNPSQFWRAYRKVAASKIGSLPSLRRGDGTFAVKDAKKAALISQAFAANFNDRDSLAPALGADVTVDANFLCNVNFVQEQVASIRLDCASGLDELPVRFLRALSPIISRPLVTMINRCVSESYWPVIWKRARMAPVPKVSAPTTADEFRPVSILPILSKVGEAWVLELLQPYMSTSVWQFGFKKQSGTNDALATATHLISAGWEACSQTTKVAVVSLDIARAFDQVPHFALLSVLQERGCPDALLSMLHSYLCGRSQVVRVNSSMSDPIVCRSGVPQGSILGPYLFNAYVDKVFQTSLSDGTSVLLYADDCLVIKAIRTDQDELDLAADLESLHRAYDNLFLRVNASKSKLLVCSLAATGAQLDRPLSIGGLSINLFQCRSVC